MDYNEELGKILANKELDNDEKTKAITKLTGDCFISKTNHRKAVETIQTQLEDTKGELETIKTSQMTEDEKLQKALNEAEQAKKEATIVTNKYAVKDILSEVIEDKEELEKIATNITTENIETTKSVAQELAETMKKQIEAREAKIREELINNTPKPTGGEEGNKAVTKDGFLKLGYEEQVKYKQENPEGYKQLFN